MIPDHDPPLPVHPEVLAASAAELERLAARLGEVGSELRRLTASGVLGARATQHCASVTSALESAFAQTGELARDVRRAAEHGESMLAELARAVLRAGGELAGSTPDGLRRVFDPARYHRPGMASESDWCPAGIGCPDRPVNSSAWSSWSPPAPRPGDGPLIADTDGQRPTSALGVRVAQLPDGS
jgi:hypothetical protein